MVLVQILGVLSVVAGVWILVNAKGAVHEIEAMICLLIFAVSMGFSAVIAEMRKALTRLGGQGQMPPGHDASSASASHTGRDGGGSSDLRGKDLSKQSLVGRDFTGADMASANLQGADLTDAVFKNADLSDADLRGARIKNTDFAGANLHRAKLASYERSAIKGAKGTPDWR